MDEVGKGVAALLIFCVALFLGFAMASEHIEKELKKHCGEFGAYITMDDTHHIGERE